jgi:hypothetical protein
MDVIIQVFWYTWRHMTDVVFNGVVASPRAFRDKIEEEYNSLFLAKLFCGTSFSFSKVGATTPCL